MRQPIRSFPKRRDDTCATEFWSGPVNNTNDPWFPRPPRPGRAADNILFGSKKSQGRKENGAVAAGIWTGTRRILVDVPK